MSRIELESERDDLKQRIEELDRILASAEALDNVVISEMDEARRHVWHASSNRIAG